MGVLELAALVQHQMMMRHVLVVQHQTRLGGRAQARQWVCLYL